MLVARVWMRSYWTVRVIIRNPGEQHSLRHNSLHLSCQITKNFRKSPSQQLKALAWKEHMCQLRQLIMYFQPTTRGQGVQSYYVSGRRVRCTYIGRKTEIFVEIFKTTTHKWLTSYTQAILNNQSSCKFLLAVFKISDKC